MSGPCQGGLQSPESPRQARTECASPRNRAISLSNLALAGRGPMQKRVLLRKRNNQCLKPRLWDFQLQQQSRIQVDPLPANRQVQMWPGGTPATAAHSDQLPGLNLIARFHGEIR